MIISDCEFVIIRVTDNYVLYRRLVGVSPKVGEFVFGASAHHVQPLVDLLPNKPYTLEVRNG